MTKLEKLLQGYHFTNELGEPILWTESQKKIMSVILDLGVRVIDVDEIEKLISLIQIETPTQVGKSSATAAALTMRTTKREKWAIVAGTAEKAQIIMDYFINYCLENVLPRELLKSQISIDKLKQDRSRRHLTFASGFEIRVFSVDSRNKQATGNAVMGFGAPYIILDEGALVDDVTEAKVFRMIMGFSNTKHLYLKIGNPFYRNHFYKSSINPLFHKIWWDYKTAIAEGRYSAGMIEMARGKPGFKVLYEVKFPDADAQDDKGWSNLLTEEDIKAVMVPKDQVTGFGFLKVGCDVAGEGTNFNAVIKRYRNIASILFKERVLDQFQYAEKVINWQQQLRESSQIMPMGYYVDKVGVGKGVYETMRVDLENVYGVNVGLNPFELDRFTNLRAEAFWRLREDIKAKKIHLEENDDWYQLANVKYKTVLEGKKGKCQIMSKDEMRANGIESPDVADALMLTYVSPDPVDAPRGEEYNSRNDNDFDRFAAFNEI